ncbi:MAG: glutaminyl-peptide cyclotransferase [Ferruginibacter sp.]
MMIKKYTALLALVVLAACNNKEDDDKPIDPGIVPAKTPVIPYTIVAEYPHDTSAYTQGLEFHDGKLYEATGDYETSSLRITDYKTGKVLKKHIMGTNAIFGEGITVFKNKIYQLTWESNIVYVYDVNNIDKPMSTFTWPYEGWGLTHNATDLIVSDGTSKLYFVDPDNFRVKNTVRVYDNSGPVDSINELEYIDGFVYANVYLTYMIIKIDPESGHIVGKMQFPGMKEKFFPTQNIPGRTDVLNGIAYDSTTKKFLITGKRWPKMFELKFN